MIKMDFLGFIKILIYG